ncbi:ABC transporter substrate-binding protein [Paraburkholderia sp. MM5477-R1]|uniref:ABC transporter substrate-binding protein n=1 Tax=Paraburkholderia sp. MM5477-R1 TaxID=2991062 RepID=UPI003D1C8485
MKCVRKLTMAAIIGCLAGTVCAQDAQWDSVVAAAKKEKTLVFYTGLLSSKCLDRNIDRFGKEYGITVQTFRARGGELLERIRVEQASNRFIGDVEWNGPPVIFLQGEKGALEPLGPLPNVSNLLPDYHAEKYAVPVTRSSIGMIINDRLVKPGDVKSWKDLTDEKWRGKIAVDQMDVLGVGNMWFDVTYQKFGQGFQEAFAKNKPLITRDWGAMERRVASGEYLAYVGIESFNGLVAKGLPVRWMVPEEGAPAYTAKLAILKNAPHPNAARVFVNFLLGTDSQLLCANEAMGPVVKGVLEKVDPSMRPYVDVKKMGEQSPDPAVASKAVDVARQIYLTR